MNKEFTIKKWMYSVYIFFLCFLYPYLLYSNSATEDSVKSGSEESFNPSEVILHHIRDAHTWHLFEWKDSKGKKHPVSIPLPIIVYYNGHLDFFSSALFHHGEKTVKKGIREYILYHDKIYLANKEGKLDFNDKNEPVNKKPVDFSITKNVFALLFSAIVILLIFIPVAGRYKKSSGTPKGIQSFIEPIVVFIRDEIAIPNLGHKKYRKYLPYLLTLFFFIFINNLIGLIPVFPGGANLTGNIAVTCTLALITLLITNLGGNKAYWKHIFLPPGVPLWLLPIMVPVEMIGIISKPFALMIRLFANITAGHIIVLSLVSLIFIFKSIYISPVSVVFVLFIDLIELLVALLQAYIFTLLSSTFIGMAIVDHEKHH